MTKILNTNNTAQWSQWKRIAVWMLQIAAAVAFLWAGGSKLVGVEQMVALFSNIGIGQWFRYLTGIIEIIGALLILFPLTAFLGGALLACTMVGGIFTHLFLVGGSPVPAIVLLLITVTIAWLRRPQVQ